MTVDSFDQAVAYELGILLLALAAGSLAYLVSSSGETSVLVAFAVFAGLNGLLLLTLGAAESR